MAKTGSLEITLEAYQPDVTPGVGSKLYYETTRNGTTVNYKIGITTFVKSSGGWYNNRIACQVNVNGSTGGVNRTIKGQTSGSIYNNTYWVKWDANGNADYWTNPSETKYAFTGSTTVNDASATTMEVKVLYKATGYGYSEDNPGEWSWNNPTMNWGTKSFTIPIDQGIINPTISGCSCTEGSGRYVDCSVTASPGSGTISSYQWTINGTPYTGQSPTVGPFAENTQINWSVKVSASDGGVATYSGTSFYISHTTKPIITGINYRDGVRSGTTYTSSDTYEGTITYHIEYTGSNVGRYSHTLEYGITTSYGSTATTSSTGNDITWNLSNLQPNTTYYYRIKEKDNGNTQQEKVITGNFLVTGIAPQLTSIVLHRGYTSCTMSPTCKYDVNATPASNDCTTITVEGFITPFKGNRSIVEITGLQSNTSYNTVTVVRDAFGRDSNSLSWGIYTDPYPTEITNLGFNSVGTTSLTPSVQFTAEPTVVTSGTMRIRGLITTYNTSTSRSNVTSPWVVNFNSLPGDNDYEVTVTISNSIGTDTDTITGSTLLEAPVINYTATTIEALDAFTVQAVVVASSNPEGRVLSYRFSKDMGQTWSNYQSSPVYTWTNLNEHTTYNICIEVKASHVATYSQDSVASLSYSITTPYDQATVAIRNGDWKYGKLYYNQNGNWLKAKKVYIKQNGSWIENKNFR